jgi:hypothetical protein
MCGHPFGGLDKECKKSSRGERRQKEEEMIYSCIVISCEID